MKKSISYKLFEIFNNFNSSNELISNVDARIVKYEIDNIEVVSTIVDEIKPNCYVVSAHSMLIEYSKDELIKLDSKIVRFLSCILIKLFETILKFAKIDKLQTLNNYMLSTNFFSSDFEKINIEKLRNMALKDCSDHVLLIRSVNKFQNPKLFDNLTKDGWVALVSRQVYIFDDLIRCELHQNYIRDKKLLSDKRYIFKELDLDDFSLFEKAEELYNQLYLEKYSKHNVQFKAQYLKELVKNELLHLRLLYDSKENKYGAVVGIIGESGVVTAPIVGYDLDCDKKEALYRRVIAYILEYAKNNDCVLNLSSGASSFKLNRGAKANLEYMFVYIHHISFFRRFIWKTLSFISISFYGRLLQRLKL